MSKHSTADAIIRLEQLAEKLSCERYEIRRSLTQERLHVMDDGEERYLRQRINTLHREERKIAEMIAKLEQELVSEVRGER